MKSTLVLGFGVSLLAPVAGMATQKQKAQAQAPNVIVIYADDLGYGDLCCYGATRVQTPNVDRLANEGIRFTNAYATASTSTPSRYSMLTGEYAWRRPGTDIAAGNAGMIIRPERYTLADMMKNAGYVTAALGKSEEDRPWVIEQALNKALSVRTREWKYIEPSEGPAIMYYEKIETGYSKEPQLYDMTKAYEEGNQALQHPDKVYQLQGVLKGVRDKSLKLK